MHGAATLLLPLAAEKSKVPFYVAGGLLATWAVVVSVLLGLRHADFPGNLMGQRAVIAISAVLVLAAISMAVVTSGSPAKTGEASVSGNLALAANPGGLLSYDKKQLSAKAGSVSITLTNSAPLEHNVTVAEGSKVLGATPSFMGGSRTLTLTLKPGTYSFYCSVPGHRAAGMQGTLSVS